MTIRRIGASRERVSPAIIRALEKHGCSVDRIMQAGLPHLLIGWNGQHWLADCVSSNRNPTVLQLAWRARWKGPAPVTLRSVADALQLLQVGPQGLT